MPFFADLHLTVSAPPIVRLHGRLWKLPKLAARRPEAAPKEACSVLALLPEAGKARPMRRKAWRGGF